MTTFLKWLCSILALAVCLAVGWLVYTREPAPVVGQTAIAAPAKEVKYKRKVGVKINAPIKVYEGGASTKKEIDLPPEVVKDDSQQVIASSQIAANDDHPHTVTTVIDTETGESQTYVRTDPLPWLAWDDRGSAGIYAGVKNGISTVRLQARQGVFSVKSLHVGVVASVDQPLASTPTLPDYFIGIGAEYKW